VSAFSFAEAFGPLLSLSPGEGRKRGVERGQH
jgi:hypothetical protein